MTERMGGGLETMEIGQRDKMVENLSEEGERKKTGSAEIALLDLCNCNLHASLAILLRLLLRNHQEKELSQHFC